MKSQLWRKYYEDRRAFIGGSDARIIMGNDEAALVQLWREKRGEAEPEDLSSNLIVQLGAATEKLNRCWYERTTGRRVTDVQRKVKHSAIPWMAATLDGVVEDAGAVFEAKFMLPWSFSEEAAAEKYMAQVQHNMWVTHLRSSVLSIITVAENGWKSPFPWTRSISAFWSQPRRSSGAASNPVKCPTLSMPSRRGRASRPSASST
jgi:putative phage-type endonuclease